MASRWTRIRPVSILLLSTALVVAGTISCRSTDTTIAEDADPPATSSSRFAFEPRSPLRAGSNVTDDDPLVMVYTAGTRMSPGSMVAISFPTAVQEEAGDLWSIPTVTDGTPGHCRLADDSIGRAEITSAGRAKGGAGRIVLRMTQAIEAGDTLRIRLTGQVPKVVPKQSFRVVEMSIDTGLPAGLAPENLEVPPVVAGRAVRLVATIPSDAATGEAFRLRIAAIDAFGNVDVSFAGSVRLAGPLDRLPPAVAFNDMDRGQKSISAVAGASPGIVRVTVAATVASGEAIVRSNPMQVWAGAPPMRRFVGDAHFHSGSDVASVTTDGGDHRGQFVASEDAFVYLRDVAAADWGISAEHDTGMSDVTWTANQERVASQQDDALFVTLPGYEWTPPRRLGHHVVVFENPAGLANPLIGASSGRRGGTGAATVAELAAALRAVTSTGRRVLMIPHIMQPFPNGDVDRDEHSLPHETWDGPQGSAAGAYVFNDLRRVGELYSHHNDDFSVDGFRQTREGRGDAVNQPQLFEVGPGNSWSYQHAWSTGHRIGVIGGSDNHFGTPGLNDFVPTIPHHAGLAVVFAARLSRTEIFDGLYARRCYATTGARILVDVTVDGLRMGEESIRKAGARIPIRVTVSGTERIDSVEVLKFAGGEFVVVPGPIERKGELDVSLTLVDTLEASTLYYIRVRQSDGEWAWSSPVWIDTQPPER